MSKPVLKLLLAYLQRQKERHPAMADLYLRDQVWLLLGFYGLLRRSELIGLQMQDVTIGGTSSTPYVELNIRFSKNDRAGQRAVVTIIGTTCDNLSIADTVRDWLKVRHRAKANPEDPFLTAWDLDSYLLPDVVQPHPNRPGAGQAPQAILSRAEEPVSPDRGKPISIRHAQPQEGGRNGGLARRGGLHQDQSSWQVALRRHQSLPADHSGYKTSGN